MADYMQWQLYATY